MKLTDNQASVYRFIRDEELAAGESEEAASRTAYEFMRDEALPDWRTFWRDWNAPPGPLEKMLQAYMGLAMLHTLVRQPQIVSTLGERVAGVLKAITE